VAGPDENAKRQELPATQVRMQLERVIQGSCLRAAPRQQRLLRHIVEATLAGEAERLKGYTLGVAVYDRGADFDPNVDPIVRVEIGRLRSKLLAHYSGEGRDDPILIEVPKGGNAARFERRGARAAGWPAALAGAPAMTRPRIAVVPFANPSAQPRFDLLADGLTEDMVTELSKLSGLFVISRHASFAYKGTNEAPPAIARELGVRYLLEGSVRSSGATLRVTARLVDAEQGAAIWAERYDSVHPELFDVQDDVTRQIVQALAVRLTPLEEARIAVAQTTSPKARGLVQQGIGHFWKYTANALAEAERALAEAVALDPEYAAAHAWLAAAAIVRHALAFDRTDVSAVRAQHHVGQALALDPLLAWAHCIDCHVKDLYLHQAEPAVAAGRRAIALDPNMADAHAILAWALGALQPEEALAEAEVALRLNPRPTGYMYAAKGRALRMVGRLEEAMAVHRLGFEAHPDYAWNAAAVGICLAEAGRVHEATRWIEAFRATNGGELVYRNLYGEPKLRARQAEAMRRLGFTELP